MLTRRANVRLASITVSSGVSVALRVAPSSSLSSTCLQNFFSVSIILILLASFFPLFFFSFLLH